MKKTVVLGITGSIAVYKTIVLIEELRKKDHDVFVIMTPAATKMVSPEEFEKASGQKVSVDLFAKDFDYKEILQKREVDHIQLTTKADVFVIAPATANTITKIAYGIADNFLTTSILATKTPVIICPAMNTNMWTNPATQKNISTLRSFGYRIVEPTSGMLACGYEGKGKLENIPVILSAIDSVIARKTHLKGKRILITAGATKEKIDDVRFITNPSSGKMGLALAEEAFSQGAEVLLLRADNAVAPSLSIPEITFSTTDQLFSLLKKEVPNFGYIFHTAAVGDFRVENYEKGKTSSNKKTSITLTPHEKLIDTIKKINPSIHLFGFKAEYNLPEKELIKKSLEKLHTAKADFIVANDVGKKDSGFASDNNDVYIVSPNGTYKHAYFAPKKEIAKKVLQLIFPRTRGRS